MLKRDESRGFATLLSPFSSFAGPPLDSDTAGGRLIRNMRTSSRHALTGRKRRMATISRQLQRLVAAPISRLRGKRAWHAAPPEFAEAGGLNYVTDDQPGIQRRRRGDD